MEEERDWCQALTDEDLVAIDAAVDSATTSLNNKRRSSSSSSSSPYVEIQNDAVESDAIIIRRRRLRRSLVSTSGSNPDVEIRNDAVESDPFRSRRRRLPRSIVALQNPNPVLSRCKAEAMRLPVMKFRGHILYSKTAIEVEQAAKGILAMIESKKDSGQFVLGLDIEWKASFRRGVSPGKAAVMQICGETDHCHVMHIFHSGIPQSLRFLLEDPTLLKVGVGIANDAVKVFKDHNVSIKSLEDLSCLANQKLAGGPQKWGLESLTRKLISKELHKPKEIRLGNWEKFFLSKGQLDYAATDAFASWYLYKVLEGLPDPEVAACQGSETLEGVTSE